jgi:hypothetical protein
MPQTKLSLSQITRQVADEWAADGKLTVPPDADSTDEDAFWTEVQRRFDEQDGS